MKKQEKGQCCLCRQIEPTNESIEIYFDPLDPNAWHDFPLSMCVSCYNVYKNQYLSEIHKLQKQFQDRKEVLERNLHHDCMKAKNPRLYRDRAEIQ